MNRPMPVRAVGAAVAMLLLVTGCGGQEPPKTTQIAIAAPLASDALEIGKPVTLRGSASGGAIARVDVYIDGARHASVVATNSQQGVSAIPVEGVVWTPPADGTHVIQLHAFGPNDAVLAKSDPLIVRVGSVQTPARTPAAASPVSPSPSPSPSAVPTAVPSPTPAAPSLVVSNDFANVRSGPDVQYALIGRLDKDAVVEVRGKSQDGKWWQIAFDKGANGVGWVFGELVQANPAAGGVGVVSAPPLPTRPPATPTVPPTPVAAAPTATPGIDCSPSSQYWIGQPSNSHGEYKFCVIEDLRYIEGGDSDLPRGTNKTFIAAWHLAGVDEIKLRIDGQPGCGGPASKGGREVIVPAKGTYQFNANEFDGGYWKVGLFVKNKQIPDWLAYGEMYLCVR